MNIGKTLKRVLLYSAASVVLVVLLVVQVQARAGAGGDRQAPQRGFLGAYSAAADYPPPNPYPPPARPPVAVDDRCSTFEDTLLDIPLPGVLDNDTDPDDHPLTAVKVSDPAHGTLALKPDGSFTYMPAENWNGTDSFTYKAMDGAGGAGEESNAASVEITVRPVNDAPLAADDVYPADEDTALHIDAPGVLLNDSDPDGDPLTAILVSGPAHGTLALDAEGAFVYTPAGNYNGPDAFTYRVSDGSLEFVNSTAAVAINVKAANDAPAASDDFYDTPYHTALARPAPAVLFNDSDVDGDTLAAIRVSGPSHGVLTLNGDGSFTYSPAAGFSGDDTFQYKASDGALESNAASVTISVHPPNRLPVARDDSYSVDEDGVLNIALTTGVLHNDSDPDGSPLTAVKITDPAHGALVFGADGSFVYTPDANWNGTDSFTYQAFDGIDRSGTAAVSITVRPVYDAPLAADDTYAMTTRGTLIIAAPGVLANDRNADGASLSVSIQKDPQHGTLTLHADGSFTYVPVGGYRGTDSFTYIVRDGSAGSSIAVVTITGIDENYVIYFPRVFNWVGSR